MAVARARHRRTVDQRDGRRRRRRSAAGRAGRSIPRAGPRTATAAVVSRRVGSARPPDRFTAAGKNHRHNRTAHPPRTRWPGSSTSRHGRTSTSPVTSGEHAARQHPQRPQPQRRPERDVRRRTRRRATSRQRRQQRHRPEPGDDQRVAGRPCVGTDRGHARPDAASASDQVVPEHQRDPDQQDQPAGRRRGGDQLERRVASAAGTRR